MLSSILLVAAQAFYTANVVTFGCTSDQEVTKLQQLRTTRTPFEQELYNEVFLGQCVIIAKGTAVEGSARVTNPNTLLVDRTVLPPGYVAPSADFTLVKAMEK